MVREIVLDGVDVSGTGDGIRIEWPEGLRTREERRVFVSSIFA